ncbi:UDP-N-acetylglucosamine 2-epimerase (hydrolyzing) [Candidatus Woesearchaeota archaeon]|nr:UDP-N-acetylglucosamine 2-epimerase (hydrolyzing) [Candidatus Woesearchaeota archaeon]
MRKITYITGTRADYGLMRKTLKAIEAHPDLQLTIIATGMHLMPTFGKTIKDIIDDGFNPVTIDVKHEQGTRESLALFFGDFFQGLIKQLQKSKPDILLLLGDRAEMLAGAVAGTYLSIPVAHLHGGEKSGHVDDSVRHAITKLARIHLPATQESAERIISMGEQKKDVHVVGAPGLVGITEDLMPKEEIAKHFGMEPKNDYLLIIHHPVSISQDESGRQIEAIITAAKKTGLDILIGLPNADPGNEHIIKIIKEQEEETDVHTYTSLPHKTFSSLMSHAQVMIGNSSAGIIEAASFKLPVVNVGERQTGRERSGNVIDTDTDEKSIAEGIKKALSKEFKERVRGVKNVYGDGKTDKRVAEILSTIEL